MVLMAGSHSAVYFWHSLVLRHFSPTWALSREGKSDFAALVFDLELTFCNSAVRLSWLCLAYPCLLLAYIGQAAYISDIPSAYANPFFLTVPPGLFWPSLVLSILAAIVASQATITATFQLLAQIMDASYFPRIR